MGNICCDRSSIRSDVCFMKGDIRTHSASFSIFLYSSNNISNGRRIQEEEEIQQYEKIKPYTRKWEKSVMDTIDQLDLVVMKKSKFGKKTNQKPCQVKHSVPAVVFSNGGYTGNVYHEFNDGILPLFITSQHLNKQVVFVALEYHEWWITKYSDILSQLSDYPVINFSGDNRTHCFPEAIVGLQIHDELAVDRLQGKNTTIRDFRRLLDRAYWPRIKGLQEEEAQLKLQLKPDSGELKNLSSLPPWLSSMKEEEEEEEKEEMKKPKLVIISRNGSRSIINEGAMVELAEDIGFQVEVLRPNPRTELAKIYRALNSSDMMVGVHGAAMTHFLFMKPGSVFIQVIPLGTDWAAETYYGDPSVKLGLKYMPYKILPRESSLYGNYNNDDPVLNDPESVNAKGWEYTKKIYLDGQNVELNLRRFRKRLVRAYDYISQRKLQQSSY
ncbi:Glycosyltransferase AER61 [Macleaya cordata]|uniref:Glycosyltransferase AER61 n=1 Tax=Macleaya cordata TaxID=56857 RepID=A0A200Q0P8_MACCD|nr:Glycosyltransferase AER61 [Macleaya cordata]